MHLHEWRKVPFKLLFLPPNGRKSRRIDYKLHRQCSCWWWWGMSWCLVWERCHCGSPRSHSCPAHQVQGNLGLIVNKSFGLKILSFIVQTASSWSKPKAKYQVKTEGNLSAVVSNNWNVVTVPKELVWTRFSFYPIFTFLRHFYSLLVTQNRLSELFLLRVTTCQNSYVCITTTCEQEVYTSYPIKNRWEVTQVRYFFNHIWLWDIWCSFFLFRATTLPWQ